MTARARAFPTVLLLAAVFASLPAGAEDDEAAIESRRQDLRQIEQDVVTLEQDLAAMHGSRAVLLTELEGFERDIADLARAGHQLQGMVSAQEAELSELHRALQREHDALAAERSTLAGLLRSAYASGRGERLRLMLDQNDAAALSRVMSYYGYFNRYRVSRIEAVEARTRRLEVLATTTAEETARLAALAVRQESTRAQLAETQAARAVLLTELEQNIAGGEGRIVALRAEAEGLRSLLDQLERQARALPEAELVQQPIDALRGRLDWPLPPSRLTARFGEPKDEGGQRWDGVLIDAPEGTEVRAVHSGRVVYADWLRGFGLLLIVEHDDGYMTLYGHNQTLLKEPGEWVAVGDPIALSGASGGLRAGGLYFAIRHRGKPLDPLQWCGSRRAADGARRTDAGAGAGLEEHPAKRPLQYETNDTRLPPFALVRWYPVHSLR